MISLKELVNKVIKNYIDYNVIDCCYAEGSIDDSEGAYYVYLVPIIEDSNFYNLMSRHHELDIEEIVKEESNVLYYSLYNYDRSIHLITSDNHNVYFNLVNGIYKFPNIYLLYRNVDQLKKENNRGLNLVKSFESFSHHLSLIYSEVKNENKYISFKYLNDAYGDLLGFLGNYYLDYSPDIDVIHYNFDEVLKKMDKRLQTNFKRMIDLLKVDTVKECTKLMIWFVDEYIGHLTINVVSKINIDYYDFVKGLF